MPWALVALWLLCLCGAPIVASAAQAAPAVHAPETATSAPAAAAQTVVEVFVREGCPHCAKAEKFLAGLARVRPDLNIVVRDVVKEPAAMARLQQVARELNTGAARVPAFFAGGQLIFGFSEEASTDKLVRSALLGQKPPTGTGAPEGSRCAAQVDSTCKAEVPPEPAFEVSMFGRTVTLDDVGLPAFTIAMGLLDGLNPCSMWGLILMISLLGTL